VTNTRRTRWAEHVAHTGERRGAFSFWWGNLKERGYLEDPGIDERVILKLKKITLEEAMKARRGSTDIPLLFL
jgi:hypothetical protein